MPTDYWWIWMILAALFIVAEIFTAGFFLLWFGVGAGVAGFLALMGVNMAGQLAVFVVVALVLFAVSRKFADRFTDPQPPGIGADRFLGKVGIVLEDVDNRKNKGRVRLERDEWRAESETGDVIAAGVEVSVTGINGTHVIVRATKEGE